MEHTHLVKGLDFALLQKVYYLLFISVISRYTSCASFAAVPLQHFTERIYFVFWFARFLENAYHILGLFGELL